MKLENRPKLKIKSKKRVGRGNGSGKGKTAGKGEKGQKKREKIKFGFEGGQLPLQRRLPQKRGKGNTQIQQPITITTSQLNLLPPKSLVDERKLKEFGFISSKFRKPKLKIVAKGNVDKPLKIALPATKKAVTIITKAGGSLVNEDAT